MRRDMDGRKILLTSALFLALGALALTAFAVDSKPPTVSIVNPAFGTQSKPTLISNSPTAAGRIKVQVQVWEDGAVSGVNVGYLSGASNPDIGAWTWSAATLVIGYNCGTNCGLYNAALVLAPGDWWVMANAVSAEGVGSSKDGKTFVTTNNDPRYLYLRVAASKTGTGMLLARDNSSQLCIDCHTPSHGHSSQSTDTGYGNWQTACNDCHIPHGTTNLYLIKEQILTPNNGLTGVILNKTSVFNAPGGFVNGTYGTGVCQICHTQTTFWKRDGTGGHNPGLDCKSCHGHKVGFKALCDSCHGQPPASLATMVNSNASLGITQRGTLYANSWGAHSVHYTGLLMPCGDCHNGGQPSNGQHNATPGPTYVDIGIKTGGVEQGIYQAPAIGNANYDLQAGGATTLLQLGTEGTAPRFCSNIYCHGSKSPNWSTDLSAYDICTKCHGEKTAGADFSAAAYLRAPGSNLTGADTGGNTAATDANVGAHKAHLQNTSSISGPVVCGECHIVPASVMAAGHIDNALPGDVKFNGPIGIINAQGGPVYNPVTGSCSNTYCHDANNFKKAEAEAGWRNGTDYQPTWANASYITTPGLDSTDCNRCHGYPPFNPHPQNIDCSGCHGHVDSNDLGFSILTNRAMHINGVVEGGAGGPCNGCHSELYGPMSGTALYHHFTTSDAETYSDNTCLMCHVMHADFGATKAATLRADNTVTTAASKDFDSTNTYGGICMSCHRAERTKRYTQPDGSTFTPAIPVNAAAAGSLANQVALYNASAHSYVVNSTFTDSSYYSANCVKCHNDTMSPKSAKDVQTSAVKFGLHNSTIRRMVNTLGFTNTTDRIEESFCFRCHSRIGDNIGGTKKATAGKDWYGGRTMSSASELVYNAITNATTKPYRHGVTNATWAGRHTPTETQASISANKHVECEDCHNPHGAGNTRHAVQANIINSGSILNGATGAVATFSVSNWVAPTYTYGKAAKEYEICFKCHSGANTQLTTWNANWTDAGKEFSRGNLSYHPVAGNSPNVLGAFVTGSGWTNNPSGMYCADCHGNNALSDAQGPHGSAFRNVLVGQYNAATTQSATGQDQAYNGLCYKCHDPNTYSASGTGTATGFASGTTNLHRDHHGFGLGAPWQTLKCTWCHVNPPHGYFRVHMIAFSTDPAPYGKYSELTNFTHPNPGSYAEGSCVVKATKCYSGH